MNRHRGTGVGCSLAGELHYERSCFVYGKFMLTRTQENFQPSAEKALRKLAEGNQRFMRGEARFPTVCKETLAQLAKEQHPFATILGCSDSRVPPELVFDADFGELFIIRV